MARRYLALSFLLGAALVAPAAAFAQLVVPGAASAAPTAGKVRIGIVLPKAQLGQGNAGQDVANPVRQLIMSYMAGPVLGARRARGTHSRPDRCRGARAECHSRALHERRAEEGQRRCRWAAQQNGARGGHAARSRRARRRREQRCGRCRHAGDHDRGHGWDAATGHGQPDASPIRQRQGEGRDHADVSVRDRQRCEAAAPGLH